MYDLLTGLAAHAFGIGVPEDADEGEFGISWSEAHGDMNPVIAGTGSLRVPGSNREGIQWNIKGLMIHEMRVIGYIGITLGGCLYLLNFYLSFLRYPLNIWAGGTKEKHRHVSIVPLLGSVFVALALIRLHEKTWVLILGILLILLDTGGFH